MRLRIFAMAPYPQFWGGRECDAQWTRTGRHQGEGPGRRVSGSRTGARGGESLDLLPPRPRRVRRPGRPTRTQLITAGSPCRRMLAEQALLQRLPVDADADWDAGGLGGIADDGHFGMVVVAVEVSRGMMRMRATVPRPQWWQGRAMSGLGVPRSGNKVSLHGGACLLALEGRCRGANFPLVGRAPELLCFARNGHVGRYWRTERGPVLPGSSARVFVIAECCVTGCLTSSASTFSW